MGHNLFASVISALAERGLAPVNPRYLKLDGTVSRYCTEGDKRPNAWAIVHDGPRPVLICGHWARGEQHVVALGGKELTEYERQAARNAVERAQRQRERELAERHEDAQATAHRLWAMSGAALESHPYLMKKMLPGVGIRQLDETLLVPMVDERGDLWNLQRIRPDGDKRFLKGGRVKGLSCRIGEPTDDVIVAEGWATSASLHLDTKQQVWCALSEANL